MAVPVFVGSTALRSTTLSTPLDISAIAVGSWMVVSVMSSINNSTVTAPGTWSILHAGEASGTRKNFLFTKIKEVSDGSTVTFSQNTTDTTAYGLVWGTGAGDITAWTVGATWLRSTSTQTAGARFDNIAHSVTTPLNDQLVLAISHEATFAKAASMEITGVSPSGWTQRLWLEQVAVNDQIETIWVGSKDMATAGASGETTITYSSQQDNNGWAVQIAISSPIAGQTTLTPTIVGSPTYSTATGTGGSVTVPRPAGVKTGDYILVSARIQNSDMTVGPAATGFTRLGPAFVGSSATARVIGIFGRPVTDVTAEPTSYTFAWTAASNNRAIVTATIVRGVDLSNPVAGYFNNYSGTLVSGTPTGRRVDSYTLDGAPVLSIFVGGAEFSANNNHVPATLPSGYTEVANITTGTDLATSRTMIWAGKKETTASPVSAAEILWTTPTGSAAEGVSLRGTNAAPPDPVGTGITAANGSGAAVKVYYNTASGARTPSALVPMRRGFATTADVLNTYGSTWAHRGGSDSYPEMSLYGYTQSVMRGYGVLEVSLARTSDGVWFGLHDQTTDRTSGGTFGNASAQTWAQIQAQNITIGAQGAPQPYMRWDKLVATYGSTHIIVADPKYAIGTYRTEFLNMVANDIGVNRAIIKYSGSGSTATAMATAAQAMGFQTWGFFYASDASAGQGGNGNLQAWGSYWTTIGMEYGASQAIWNEALAIGKPVIGHIAPNQAAYNAAMNKGAIGVQVSGVGVVEPVSWWNILPKSANLIAAYGFNEGIGSSVADSSIKGNNLTIGTSTDWVAGHKGYALHSVSTAGTGAYNTSFTNPTAAVTLMGWVKPHAVTGEIPLFGFWSSPASDPAGTSQLSVYASRSAFGPSSVLSASTNISGTQFATTGAQMTIDTWQHVAVTYDGASVKLYLNGTLVSSTNQSGTLGSGSFVTTAKTNVTTDEVRVLNAALTQAEIVKWMNRSI